MRARGLRSPWPVGRERTVAMIDLRMRAHGLPHHTSTTRLPPSPPLSPPYPPPLQPAGGHRIHREVARPAGRSVDFAPVAPPVSVGRNVDSAAAALLMKQLYYYCS